MVCTIRGRWSIVRTPREPWGISKEARLILIYAVTIVVVSNVQLCGEAPMSNMYLHVSDHLETCGDVNASNNRVNQRGSIIVAGMMWAQRNNPIISPQTTKYGSGLASGATLAVKSIG
jgi:hypothetical protein